LYIENLKATSFHPLLVVFFSVVYQRRGKGRSFTAAVLTEAEKWLLAMKHSPPYVRIQDTAFHRFSRHKNTTVLRAAFRFFQLPPRPYFLPIRQLAAAGKYKLWTL